MVVVMESTSIQQETNLVVRD